MEKYYCQLTFEKYFFFHNDNNSSYFKVNYKKLFELNNVFFYSFIEKCLLSLL